MGAPAGLDQAVLAPAARRRVVLDVINSARRRLLLSVKARSEAGVAVQILADKQVAGLVSHGRLAVLDGRSAIVGSMALSSVHLDTRREVAVIVQEPRAVADLVGFFDGALRFDRARGNLALASRAIA